MRRGTFISMFATFSLLVIPACGDDGETGDSAGTETGTAETTGETDSAETGTTTQGDGDGDPATGDGDGDQTGDGDGDQTGDGDGDMSGDGDGDQTGDGDGDQTGDGDGDQTGDGDGDQTGDGDGDMSGDGDGDMVDPCGTVLLSTVRDFQIAHPDMQYVVGVDEGIVEDTLGIDGKPVYAGDPTTPTTNGVDAFNQWYNDVQDVNMPFEVPIELIEIEPGLYEYDNNAFFPIDDQGWGNEGNDHNFHFTLELHTQFQYQGGEVFTFEGDDDLWVFVNGQLGIDLGGVHGPLEGSIDMDAQAQELGLEIGQYYDLDFFFAERHTSQSNFTITTTISCFNPQ